MQFLASLYALGAAALAIPILLHLVRHQTSGRLPFASLMFFDKIPRLETRRRRLKHLFLLFLRCLGLLLLVAAFARPVLTGAWFGEIAPISARSVVILFDHSLSMSRHPVWQRALELARGKIASLEPEDEGLLVQFGQQAEVLGPWRKGSSDLRVLLPSLVPSHQSTSYAEALRVAVEMLREAGNARQEIYLITDMQRSGLWQVAAWNPPAGVTLELGDAGLAHQTNLFIRQINLNREVFGATYRQPLTVEIGSSPPQALRGEAQLFLEGKLVERQDFDLDEQGQDHVSFDLEHLQKGPNRARIHLEPSDVLPQDNQYFFILERREPRTVLILSDSQTPGSTFYLQSALTSGENLPFRPLIQAPSQLRSLDPKETGLVIFHDLRSFPPAKLFRRYLASGGRLILVSGKRTRPRSLGPEWEDLLPATFNTRTFVRSSGQLFTSLVELDWSHPSLAIFPEEHRSALSNIHFFGYWKIKPTADSRIPARFGPGDPALVERTQGPGKILLFTSSPDISWNDFPLRGAYLPFWHGLVQYLLDWNPSPASLAINDWLPRDATLEGDPGPSTHWNVIDPRGKRLLGLGQEGQPGVTLNLPGYYEIRSNKESDWLAVNPSAQESNLTRLLPEELKAAWDSTGQDAKQTESTTKPENSQQPLWWYFLLLAGGVFGLESVVANRHADVRILNESSST